MTKTKEYKQFKTKTMNDAHLHLVVNHLPIIIPIAGESHFIDSDYYYPKPLIDINDKPLIQYVIESLNLIENNDNNVGNNNVSNNNNDNTITKIDKKNWHNRCRNI